MRSVSSLSIEWVRPSLGEERWEFESHPAKQPFYQRHDVTWDRLAADFKQGALVPWPRGVCLGAVPIQLAYCHYEDYQRFLAKARRNYRLSYQRMETALQRDGSLALPAPIVLLSQGEGLLFSGYRRLCLAWNYGMTPYVWCVEMARKHDPGMTQTGTD